MAIAKPFWTPELHIGSTRFGYKKTEASGNAGYFDFPPAFPPLGLFPFDNIGSGNEKNTIFNTGLIFFENDYIEDVSDQYRLKINVPLTKIMPLLWNMKEWDVQYSCSFYATDIRDYYVGYESQSPNVISVSSTKNGKFSAIDEFHSYSNFYGESDLDIYQGVRIPYSEPHSKIYGEPSYDGVTNDMNALCLWRLLPQINNLIQIYPRYSDGISSPKTEEIIKTSPAGGCTTSITIDSYLGNDVYTNPWYEEVAEIYLNLFVEKLVIKNDNTADIYFGGFGGSYGSTNPFSFSLAIGYIGSIQGEGNIESPNRRSTFHVTPKPIENTTSFFTIPSPIFEGEVVNYELKIINLGSSTINLLGVEKEVYLSVSEDREYLYNENWTPTIPEDFSFNFSLSYDIDVSEFWEYE